jgi:flagellar hook-associated protein 3 FlgL
MSTRITNNMMSRSVLADINDIQARQTATQRKMSSGKEITRPSDDPFGAGRALSLRTELAGIQQYGKNAQEAQGWMTVTDTALGKLGDLAQRARELVVSGATDTMTASGREAVAKEIDQLIAGMKQEANATYDGRYVLAGNGTVPPSRPYDSALVPTAASSAPPPAPVYNDGYLSPDSVAQNRTIGAGVPIQVDANGTEVLGGTPTSTGNMLGVLRDIAAHLRSTNPADTAQLGTQDLRNLDGQIDNLLGVRARIGAGMNRLETAQSRLGELEEATTSLLSNVEDADMAKTMIDFSTQQAVYQSALNVGARIIQPSLLDFLH